VTAGVPAANVLVPLDGSEFALAALPTARAIANRFDADLHSISVVDRGADGSHLGALGAAALGVPVGDDHSTVVTDDDVSGAILRRAVALGDCVVCMSTHGRGRLSGAVVGSVAREVVQRSVAPLVALGPLADRPGWSPTRLWPEPLSVPRIIACVDGSKTSEQVLPVAATWARALEMTLTILRVVEDGLPPLRVPDSPGPANDPASYVEGLAKQFAEHAPEVRGEVVRDPIGVASALKTYLDQRPAGLVALTTHARAGMQRVLFGATGASIVYASTAPCLVVPLPR
jgi:nucleotide-binding universal stress UspA family protein